MKFSVGDKVLLKQTGEEGEIIAFISKTMLEVAVNGVHFPVFTDEVDHPYLKWFTAEKKAAKKSRELTILTEKAPPKKLARGIYLSYMPVFRSNVQDDIVEQFRVFLLNETPTPIRFQYGLKTAGGTSIFSHSGELHPFGHIYVHNVSFDQMAEQPRATWELAEAVKKVTSPPQKGVLRIRPQKLFEHIQQMLETGEPSFAYLLAEDAAPIIAATIKLDISAAITPANTSPNTAVEADMRYSEIIDLHAAALLPEHTGIAASQILHYQITALEKHIDTAYATGLSRIVIIHGIGSGTLREAVREALSNSGKIERTSEDWEGAYGYGATIAYFTT